MKFKRFLIVVLLALAVTAVGINLSAVEGTTSPIESFWLSIPDQYKTKLKVYNEKGEFAYIVEMVLGNETTLGYAKADMLQFFAGAKEAALLIYIFKPEDAVGGEFKRSKLIIKAHYEFRVGRSVSMGTIKGPLADLLVSTKEGGRYVYVNNSPIPGILIISKEFKKYLKKFKEEKEKVVIYYKGGGPRVELKLPGEI